MSVRDGRPAGIAAGLLVSALAVQAASPGFLSPGNVRDLLVQSAPFVVLACGMALVLLLGEIDVSVGSMVGLLAALLGSAASPERWGLPAPLAVGVVLLAGTLLGALNGLLVAVAGLPSIIVTLGMLTVLRGCTELLMGGEWITDLPPSVRLLGTGQAWGVPVPVWVAGAMAASCIVLTGWTRWGRRLYATGSSAEAAWSRGVRTHAVRLQSFALLGLFAAVAALVSVPQLSVIEPGLGRGWELTAITAVVVGGVGVAGGTGTVFGAVLAVLLLGSVRTMLVFLKLGDQATYWEQAVQGVFILLAVLTGRLRPRGVRR